MAKAILLCGKIASGKSVYASQLCQRERAVLLSVDEITIGVLGGDLGAQHDAIAGNAQAYLYKKSLEILRAGANVLLDWGFWTREARAYARDFYACRGIEAEFHYIDVPDDVWARNIALRNRAVLRGETQAYYLDDGLMEKLGALFEKPERAEMDVWYVNRWE